MSQRQQELAQRLDTVRTRIRAACAEAGRDPADVVLIAVSKTWPVADVAVLHELGVTDFGENRLAEYQQKADQLSGTGIRWHFLGQIQSKKAAAVGRTAAVVHSVDRERLVAGLARGAREAGVGLDVLIQVSLADLAPTREASGRGGATPQDVAPLAEAIVAEPGLRLAGVMALPPRTADPAVAFAQIVEIGARLQREHPEASWVSAGMSHDFPAAIRAGATHVRIGSALFGERPPVR